MGFWDFLRPGKGTFTPGQRAELEAEGLVLIEEGLPGTVRYTHFKAPGRRFHGKVVPEQIALGISRERLMIYCRNGRAKLTDSPWTEPKLRACEAILHDDETVDWRVDYDKLEDQPKVSGQVTIRMRTASASRIASEINARIARQ